MAGLFDDVQISDGNGGFITLGDMKEGGTPKAAPPTPSQFDNVKISDGNGGYITMGQMRGVQPPDYAEPATDIDDLEKKQDDYLEDTTYFGRIGKSLKKGTLQADSAAGFKSAERLVNAEDRTQENYHRSVEGAREQAQALFEKHGKPGQSVSDFMMATPRQYRPGQRMQRAESQIDSSIRNQQQAQQIEQAPVVDYVMQAETLEDVLKGIKVDPISFIAEVGITSLPQSLASLVAGAAGGVVGGLPGAMAGTGVTSGAADYASSFVGGLQQYGVDINDNEAVIDAFRDPELMQQIKEDSDMRAVVVGTFDAMSLGLAGAPISKALGKIPGVEQGVKTGIADVSAKILGGGALGGAGEYFGEKVEGR